WGTRKGAYIGLDTARGKLLKHQGGRCAHCQLFFTVDANSIRNEYEITSPTEMAYSMLTALTPSLLHERSGPVLAGYSPTIEAQMRAFYQSLSEKDRRRYAAIEACKLG